MPGTVDNPVRLSPARNIREVAWPSPWLAFNVSLIRRTEDEQFVTPGAPSAPFDTFDASYCPFDTSYLTGTRYELLVESAATFAPVVFRGASWVDAPGFSITGLPVLSNDTLATFSYGDWQQPASQVAPPAESEWQPFVHWQAITGADIEGGVTLPGDPSGVFKTGTVATAEMLGWSFTSEKKDFQGTWPGGACLPAGGYSFQAAARSNEDLSLPSAPVISGSGAAYSVADAIAYSRARPNLPRRAFRPIGLAIVGEDIPPASSIRPSKAGQLWVLCQRSPADDLP
jgi:hypothetical protein